MKFIILAFGLVGLGLAGGSPSVGHSVNDDCKNNHQTITSSSVANHLPYNSGGYKQTGVEHQKYLCH